ncbi:predicted protein [Histoplasma mississippiense (nom. inval.)]|uniref:predicted protein n=1 Tax=Ajellomyces capsulatus (strain NAm1 / WU24) TaxID=2059318 RepID=UPI000157CEEC|nr:predicted protein [Histoplasma mississippiense (nom. inval.)]EDN11155.1 predicted protein [Histoplasma mississippiense (nom. inval.)]
MLDNLYQEALSSISAPLDVPPKQLSNNQSQPPGEIEPDSRDNISDSGATTEPLALDEFENLPYWYKAQQVEKSLKICHVEKVWQKNKHVHRVLYVVETYLPDNWLPENARLQLQKQEEKQRREEKLREKLVDHDQNYTLKESHNLAQGASKNGTPCGVGIPAKVSPFRSARMLCEHATKIKFHAVSTSLGKRAPWRSESHVVLAFLGKGAITSVEKATKLKVHKEPRSIRGWHNADSRTSFGTEGGNASPVSVRATMSFQSCTGHGTHYIFVWWWKVAAESIRLVKVNCKVPIIFMDEKIDALAATVIKVATQHTLECAFSSVTHLHKTTVLSPWLLDTLCG